MLVFVILFLGSGVKSRRDRQEDRQPRDLIYERMVSKILFNKNLILEKRPKGSQNSGAKLL